jgi:hypothetical protein
MIERTTAGLHRQMRERTVPSAVCHAFFLLVFGLLATHCFGETGPQLSLDTAKIREVGTVDFTPLFLRVDQITECPSPRFNVGETGDRSFRLCVDLNSIQPVNFNGFTFTAYLLDERQGKNSASKFQINASPTGTFGDQAARIYFHVTTGKTTSEGWITAPVYNLADTDLLIINLQKEPYVVSVSAPGDLELPLKSPPDILPIYVTNVSPTYSCSKCWSSITSNVSDKTPLVIETGTTGLLRITLVAKSLSALLKGALILNPDLPHDTVELAVTYHTAPGGTDRKQLIPVNIRFKPTLPALALGLLGGVALGLLARYLINGRLGEEHESKTHAIITAVVFGIVAEVIGVLLVSVGNTELKVFGLELDPRQVFPAFILMMLVSGGSEVVSWVQKLFKGVLSNS